MPQIFKTVTLGRFTCAWRARKATAHPLSAKFEASEPIIAASKGVSIGANIVQPSTSTHNPFRECFPTKSLHRDATLRIMELTDMIDWQSERRSRGQRLGAGSKLAEGKMVAPGDATALLEAVIRPGDRICLEGDNQKQADFLAACLANADPKVLHDLHVVQSGIVLPEHIDLFEKGIAKKLDYSYSGPQSYALPRALNAGKIELGAIHTYVELFARYFVDLTPHVALTVARSADRQGNLYMGPNTEDSPTVIEATAFKDGIVIAQVNEVVDKLPRVDIPGDRVDFVVAASKPFYVEPLFTRDPASITETQILAAMIAIKGLYAEYGIKRLNHGIGFNTAAIELLLPTYAEKLGLKGKIATHWALNPHPTLIPAIEFGVGQTDP